MAAPARQIDRWWPPSTSMLAPTMNAGAAGGQKRDRVGDVVRRAPAAERHLGAPFRLLLLQAAAEDRLRCGASGASVERTLDAARAHRVDQDIARREFIRTAI